MNIYTYYEDVGFPKPEGLLKLWTESWKRQGWTPIILDREKAMQSSRFKRVLYAANVLPTVNERAYEIASYVRYCAMETIGGGFLVDYDCINYSLKPESLANVKKFALARLAEGGFTWMTHIGARRFCDMIIDWIGGEKPCMLLSGQPHLSDMHMAMFMELPFLTEYCLGYNVQGWQKASIVHYNTNATGQRDGKELLINEVRPL